jgi:hypothetical protein
MKNVLYFLFIALFFACKPNEQKPGAAANTSKYPEYAALMQTHDQAMKGMGRVAELQKALKDKLHAYEAANDFGPLSKEVRNHLSELNKAENEIATWKTTYGKQLPDTMSVENRNNYFILAKGDVEIARDQILYSVQQAEKILKTLESEIKK